MMSETGGGKGTNQYQVRGISQASRQAQSVVDELAATEESDLSVPDEAEVRCFACRRYRPATESSRPAPSRL